MEVLLFIYVVTMGLVPLLISLVGAGLGFALARRFGKTLAKFELSSKPQFQSASPAQLTAVWAASLFVGQSSIQYLIFLSSGAFSWGGLRAILIGLHLCIWILGTILAYLKHRDLRVAAYLIGIAVVLFIVRPWLPSFILLAVSIGFLLFCIVRKVFMPPGDNTSKTPADRNVNGVELSGSALFELGDATNDNDRPSNPLEIFIVCTMSCFCAVSFLCFPVCLGKALHDGYWGPVYMMAIATPLALTIGCVGAIISALMPPSERTSAREVWKVTAVETGMMAVIWLLFLLVPPFR